jgi:predicted ribosome quality control (RQC) complex YloA/Tae2 family protein
MRCPLFWAHSTGLDPGGRGGETESHEATELNSLTLELLQTILTKNTWQPHFSHESGAYPLDFTSLDPTAIPRPTLSIALEQAYALRESRDALASQRQSLLNQLQRVADARRAALRGITEAIATANRAPKIQAQAELILAYQGSIQPGQETLEAYDYQGNPITIPLDPEKTAVENANRLFNRAKHAKERRDEVATQGDRLHQDLTTVESLIQLVQSATTREALDQHRAEAKSRNYLHLTGAPKAKEDRPFEGHPIRELLSPAGYRVLYGTNSTSNDYLTNRVAKGNDIWLHVRGQTSAHVIIQTQGNPDKVQKPDLLFAALVAVKNSPAKHGSYVPVDYTLKKYVRKPRGSAPGLAVYEREKTLHVDP